MNRRNVGVLLGLGFTLATSTLAGLYLGLYLDKRTGKTLFAPAGLLLGLAAGIHQSVRVIRNMLKKGK
ncbi:MAG: AtpZ/AtpI family protein [Bacillota bacterium]